MKITIFDMKLACSTTIINLKFGDSSFFTHKKRLKKAEQKNVRKIFSISVSNGIKLRIYEKTAPFIRVISPIKEAEYFYCYLPCFKSF